MSVQDEFAAFIRGLQPRIETQVGALVEEDLAAAMRLAARLELWMTDTSGGGTSGQGGGGSKQKGRGRGGQGARQGGQGPNNQGKVQAVESSVAAMDQGKKKQQQQGKGQGQGKRPPCYLCQGAHFVKDCPNLKAASEALKKAKSKNA